MAVVRLRYSREGLPFRYEETPGFLGLLEPRPRPPLADPDRSLGEALRRPISSPPLRDLAQGKRDAVIVISDSTRPVPNRLLLPRILEELAAGGLGREKVTILIATGIHRPNEGEELLRLVGPEIVASCRIENHFSKRDEDMVDLGEIGPGVPALVNRRYVEADLKILTGFIEPHMWAGYSGGRKSILPGISSVRTLEFMHGPRMIADPEVVYGKLRGNPFHEAGLRAMELAGADFIVNVTLGSAKSVTGIYCGHPIEAHYRGAAELEPSCTAFVDRPLDFVVTSNAGAPLDVNLYQTSKGIAGVAPVVRPGGDIVIASRCDEGLGSPEFKAAMDEFTTPAEWAKRALAGDFFYPDQWCAQEIFKWMADRRIHLHSEGVPDEVKRRYGFVPAPDLEATLAALLERHGRDATWAIVPEGPLVIVRPRGQSAE